MPWTGVLRVRFQPRIVDGRHALIGFQHLRQRQRVLAFALLAQGHGLGADGDVVRRFRPSVAPKSRSALARICAMPHCGAGFFL
jgi:hypothetical protein